MRPTTANEVLSRGFIRHAFLASVTAKLCQHYSRRGIVGLFTRTARPMSPAYKSLVVGASNHFRGREITPATWLKYLSQASKDKELKRMEAKAKQTVRCKAHDDEISPRYAAKILNVPLHFSKRKNELLTLTDLRNIILSICDKFDIQTTDIFRNMRRKEDVKILCERLVAEHVVKTDARVARDHIKID